MSASCPQYLVRFHVKGAADDCIQMCGNGPFDYRRNALSERDRLFASRSDVDVCWIEKEGVASGRRLVRL